MKIVIRLLYIALVSMLISLPALAIEEKTDPLIEIQKDIASLKTTAKQTQKELGALKQHNPDKNYVDILEKTNQQLWLIKPPYSTTFTILASLIAFVTVMIGLMAIAAAIVISRQGRDYQKKLDQDREGYKEKLEELIASYKKQITTLTELVETRHEKLKEIDENIDAVINEYQKKLKVATKEQKKEIDKAILELKAEKAKLQTETPIGDLLSGLELWSKGLGFVTCPKCKNFIPKKPKDGMGVLPPVYICDSCGSNFIA